MTGVSMLLIIAALMILLYVADVKTRGAAGNVIEIVVVLFLLVGVFVAGGGHFDGSGSWSLGKLIDFIGGAP